MNTFFYFLEIFLTVLIGFCGLALIIIGCYMGSEISLFFGGLALVFCVLVPRLEMNNKNG